MSIFENERHGFMGDLSDHIGNIILIILVARFRHLLDDTFVTSPFDRNLSNPVIDVLNRSVRKVSIH